MTQINSSFERNNSDENNSVFTGFDKRSSGEERDASEQSVKKNPFKDKMFYLSYVVTLVVLCAVSIPLLRSITGQDWWTPVTLALCIPSIIVGIIVWTTLKRRRLALALGILFGSQTPFVIVCALTGGCGLYTYWTLVP